MNWSGTAGSPRLRPATCSGWAWRLDALNRPEELMG